MKRLTGSVLPPREGAFVDRALLEQNEHSVMSNVLRRVPGVSLVRVPGNGKSYSALGSARGTTRVMGQPGRPRSPHCFYQVYVDGVLRYAPSDDPSGQPPPDVDELKPYDYDAIEVYRGGAQVPQRYGGTGAACGTVLLWSRTR
jgi:outer membrane receptor for Fe3+-dicitrate